MQQKNFSMTKHRGQHTLNCNRYSLLDGQFRQSNAPKANIGIEQQKFLTRKGKHDIQSSKNGDFQGFKHLLL